MHGRSMRVGGRWCAIPLIVCALCGPTQAGAQERVASSRPAGPSFWHATSGVVAINGVTWAYNTFVQRWPWSKVGTHSWGKNLQHGFVWDNDCFLDNQLAHPYHGSLYFNSARASGYGFWGSFPFVAFGSASWEIFGEKITPSLNDLINTTFGGIALGEVTYRLSALLGSGPGGGPGGFARRVGAFAFSPIARTQGFLSRRADQPQGWEQSAELARFAVGRRSGHAFVELAMQYGSPFDSNAVRPYDAFEFRLQVSPEASGAIHHVGVSGLLARRVLRRSARDQLVLGLFQHYDYDDLTNLKFSGHSVSWGLLYQHQLGPRTQIRLGARSEGLLLGGISSDYGSEWRRDYDLGPGAGARVNASFARDGREWLRLDGRFIWLHSIHGADADHLASFLRMGASLPVAGSVGLGGDLALTTRSSHYQEFPSVYQRIPHARAYLTWTPY